MLQSFDTLAASKRLRDSGMPMNQADATVGVVGDAVRNLVTREYLDSRLESLETRIDGRFNKVDARLNKMDARLDKMDSHFDKMDARFDKMDARFEKVHTIFDGIDSQFGKQSTEMSAQMARWAFALVLSQVAVGALVVSLISYIG